MAGRVRRRGLRWASAFFAVVFCLPSLALLDLVAGLLPVGDDAASSSAMSNVAFGVLGVVLISPAFASLAWRGPDASLALPQVLAVVLSLVAASVWSGATVGILGATAVLLPLAIVAALHPAPRSSRAGGGWTFGGPWMLGCAVALVVPAWVYAGVMAAHGRAAMPPENSFAFVPSHWVAMAAALVATSLVAVLAAAHGGGWTLSAVCAAVAVLVFGLASVVNPHAPSSGGRGWGVAALVWVVVWLVVSRRARVSAVEA